MQIIVLGMHRSGTSLTTRMINMMGAYVGPEGMCGFNNDNPKGFWERRDVVQCNALLLKLNDPAWPDIHIANWIASWADKQPPYRMEDVRRSMKTILLNMDAHRPWVMKDPYLCLTLPYWKPLLEVPVCIIVYRDPLEIAGSLRIRENNAVPSFERSMALWEYYTVGMLNATGSMPRLHVAHADLLHRPVETCEMLCTQLMAQGVRRLAMPMAKEIEAFIDPALYRSKPGMADTVELSPAQQALAEILQGLRPQKDAVTVSESSQSVIRARRPTPA